MPPGRWGCPISHVSSLLVLNCPRSHLGVPVAGILHDDFESADDLTSLPVLARVQKEGVPGCSGGSEQSA